MTPDEDTIRFIATRAIEGYRDGLRAKVEALHPDWLGTPADVLALIDGGSE
jgi:hypothetical protein